MEIITGLELRKIESMDVTTIEFYVCDREGFVVDTDGPKLATVSTSTAMSGMNVFKFIQAQAKGLMNRISDLNDCAINRNIVVNDIGFYEEIRSIQVIIKPWWLELKNGYSVKSYSDEDTIEGLDVTLLDIKMNVL